ncbi:MAG: hypothetical protein RBR22_01445 [Desulfuromonas sp.]|nr:hypothetical protein [Desulfuromonas sp.]
MNKKDLTANINELLLQLDQSMEWLEHSFQLCKEIKKDPPNNYTIEDFDKFETLTSRFARTADILIQKIYRSIDLFEMETPGTMIDIVNRAHKRGIINSPDDIRNIKDLRNDIAHEYMQEQLIDLFNEVVELTPLLMVYVETARKYCAKMLVEVSTKPY